MNKDTVQINARLPRRLADHLKAFADRHGLGVNDALTLLLEESLAMAGHPESTSDSPLVVGQHS